MKSKTAKIRESFCRSTLTKLHDEVLFHCLYYFGLPGRETLRYLTRDSFQIKSDSSNQRYEHLFDDRLSEKCKATLSPEDFEDAKKVRVYKCLERSNAMFSEML